LLDAGKLTACVLLLQTKEKGLYLRRVLKSTFYVPAWSHFRSMVLILIYFRVARVKSKQLAQTYRDLGVFKK